MEELRNLIKRNSKFLVIGLGLIGGSYAEGLRRKGYEVYGVDTNPNVIKYALKRNIISAGSSDIHDFVANVDYIIFGVYPNVIKSYIEILKPILSKNVIVTDVTGVKTCFLDDIQKSIDNKFEFIASHPMAGKEVLGIENADCKIFKGANFIITPTENNTERGIKFTKDLANILEFKTISILTPKEHDEMIAFTSQLTHTIAVSLINAVHDVEVFKYTGDSFNDLTRISKIDENLWSELFINNKDALVIQIDKFMNELADMKKIINEDRVDELKAKFISSTSIRKSYEETR